MPLGPEQQSVGGQSERAVQNSLETTLSEIPAPWYNDPELLGLVRGLQALSLKFEVTLSL